MEVSPGNVLLPNPRRALKRSASTASLPTPPRTHRRHKRGRSRGDCDSDSDKEAEIGGSALSSSDEDDELPRLDPRLRKKRRLSYSKGEDGDEAAFWLAGPDPDVQHGEDKRQGKAYPSDTDKEEGAHDDDLSSSGPLLYRKSLQRSQSQSSNGLASPPPSHRKPQTQAPITPPVGIAGPSAALLKTQPASPPKTPRKQTGLLSRIGLKSPEFPIISDSPDNPFYVVPGSPSPGEESESPRVDSVSPRTPGVAHLEKPTVTYVFRGVRREYQNPLYNHRENRPLTPPSTSFLPIEHPDFSPDIGCKPTVLFPKTRKGKRPEAAKGEPAGGAGTSTVLRRSPRRKKVMVGDSDDENELESRQAIEEEEETIIKPRKLNFGLPRNSAPRKTTKARAVTGNDGLF